MTDQPTIPETGTALATIETTNLALIFALPGGVENTISAIERDALAQAARLDASTEAGRKALRSLGAKVARSKTAMDGAGKELNESKRAEIGLVDADRRLARDRMDALKVKVLQSVVDYEAHLAEIEATNNAQIAAIQALAIGLDSLSPAEIHARYMESKKPFPWAIQFGSKRDAVLKEVHETLIGAHRAAKEREAEAAAEAIRQAEEAERQRLEAIEAQKARDATIAAEATRLAEIEAARQAQEAEKAAQARLEAAAVETRKAQELADRLAAQAESNRVAELRNALATMQKLANAKTSNEAVLMVETDLATLAHVNDRDWAEFREEAHGIHAAVEAAVMGRLREAEGREKQAEVDRKENQRVMLQAAQKMAEAQARQELADKQAADEAAAAEREKNVAHQRKTNGEIVADIMKAISETGISEAEGKIVAVAVMKALARKEIRHTKIEY